MQDMKIRVKTTSHSEAIQRAWLADNHAPLDGVKECIPYLDSRCFLYLWRGVILWESDEDDFDKHECPEYVFINGEFYPVMCEDYQVEAIELVDDSPDSEEPVPEESKVLSNLFTLNEAPYSGKLGLNAKDQF